MRPHCRTLGALSHFIASHANIRFLPLFSLPVSAVGKAPTWRERGRGEVRCSVRSAPNAASASSSAAGGARLIMRAAGHLRLLLNAALYPGMVISTLDGGKGISFLCVNAAEDGSAGGDAGAGSDADKAAPSAPAALRTFAVRLRGGDAEERTGAFKAAVEEALAALPKPAAAKKEDAADAEEAPAAAANGHAAGEDAV
jgi:hypothetical protein